MAFDIELTQDWASCADFIDELAAVGFEEEIFQSRFLLGTWFDTVGKKSSLEIAIVKVRDKSTRTPVMLLPLIVCVKNGLRIIEFADCDVIDYNGPLLNPNYAFTAKIAQRLMRDIRKVLPAHDLINLEKVRKVTQGKANPFSLLARARPSAVNGNVVHISEDWETYHNSLSRKFRKELRRSDRVLQKTGPSEYLRVRTVEKGLEILDFINTTQRQRIAELGLDYSLDDEERALYYHQLVVNGIESGACTITIIESEGETVAAIFGIATGKTQAALRLVNASGKWTTCGPGRLIMFNSIRLLYEQGFRSFDFTIGNYPLKQRIGVDQLELINLVYAGSMKGLRAVSEHLLRGLVRQLREKGILKKKVYRDMGT